MSIKKCRMVAAGFLLLATGLVSGRAIAQPTLPPPQQPRPQQSPPQQSLESQRGFLARTLHDESGPHKYMVYVPQQYDPKKSWPVILFLHGAGERGNDGVRQTTVGLGAWLRKTKRDFPFLVVFPQCEDRSGPARGGWLAGTPDATRALKMLDAVEAAWSVDRSREYLAGWSMGGYGVWSVGAATASRWAALIPIAGGGEASNVLALKDSRVWAFHGRNDQIVAAENSRRLIDALRDAGGTPLYSEIANSGHDVWKSVLNQERLYAWLADPSQSPPRSSESGYFGPETTELDPPFVPALEIPRAITLRIGNEVLGALRYSILRNAPPGVLSGSLANISTPASVEGYRFNVTFSRIGYSASLQNARVRAYAPERINIQLAIENLRVTVGHTSVRGRGRSAWAGPINIVVGHRGPVWLSVDVTPYVSQRRLRLRLVGSRFEIPSNNWYVSPPAGVSVRGLGMKRNVVSQGLVRGIYQRKSRIEQAVSEAVRSIVPEIERRMVLPEQTDIMSALWPLPVYRPRVRLWPDTVSTDKDGLSLSLGLTAAALDATRAPASPRQVAVPDAASNTTNESALSVGLAPQLLEPLSNMLIKADVARIHVADVPAPGFASLSDYHTLATVIPELKRFGPETAVRTELVLREPFSIRPGPELGPDEADPADDTPPVRRVSRTTDTRTDVQQPAGPPTTDPQSTDTQTATKQTDVPRPDVEQSEMGRSGIEFRLPRVLLLVSIRPPSETEWTRVAEFTCAITDHVRPEVASPSHRQRAVALQWSTAPEISVSGRFDRNFQAEDKSLDEALLAEMLRAGWTGFTRPSRPAQVADVAVGSSLWRLSGLGWRSDRLTADFSLPTIRLTNRTEDELIYQVKDPTTSWRGPFTLKPGFSHSFNIAHPILFRRRVDEERFEKFTLEAGSHTEFRQPRAGGPPRLFTAQESTYTGDP